MTRMEYRDAGSRATKPPAWIRRLLIVALWTLVPSWAVAQTPATTDALRAYVEAPDDSFAWTERRRGTHEDCEFVELTLTSQTWRGGAWKHQLFIIRPPEVTDPSRAILMIGGSAWTDDLAQPAKPREPLPSRVSMYVNLARQTGSLLAVALQVPQQPLFGGMVEDRLIAYTFGQYLLTGDGTWPLLLPMVKSAVRAMDATQQFAKREWSLDVERFTVSGASKRGWTTWLTAALDPRVEALAPMVIDILNMGPQMEHQLASYGKYSEQIGDYTSRGLQQFMNLPRGQALRALVDPYEYREQIKQPKLIILATNDPYWTLDALNLYWDELRGEKHILYCPNQRHGINDPARVVGTLAAFHRAQAGELKMAAMTWKFAEADGKLLLDVSSDTHPQQIDVWVATSPTRDFRKALWTVTSMAKAGDGYRHELEIPANGYAAMFAEAEFATDRMPYFESTNVRIVGGE